MKKPAIYVYYPDFTKSYSKITFTIIDYSGDFKDGYLEVVDTDGHIIEQEPISSDYQALCYLVSYGSYTLRVRKGSIVRLIGLVIIDTTSKTVTLSFAVTPENVLWNSTRLDVWIENGTIYAHIVDLENYILSVDFKVYNYMSNVLLYNISSSGSDITFSYITPNNATKYLVVLEISHSLFGTFTEKRILYEEVHHVKTEELGFPEEITSIGISLVGIMIIIVIGLLFSKASTAIGAALIAFLVPALTYAGILQIPLTFSLAIAAIAIIYAIITRE